MAIHWRAVKNSPRGTVPFCRLIKGLQRRVRTARPKPTSNRTVPFSEIAPQVYRKYTKIAGMWTFKPSTVTVKSVFFWSLVFAVLILCESTDVLSPCLGRRVSCTWGPRLTDWRSFSSLRRPTKGSPTFKPPDRLETPASRLCIKLLLTSCFFISISRAASFYD